MAPGGGVGRCIAPGSPGACDRQPEPGSLFCRHHEQAPAARRGGWISAERRRLQRAQDRLVDMSNVSTRLWVGAHPPIDRDLPDFDLLVLCAQEFQPQSMAFHGQILRCPIPDAALDIHQITQAVMAAKSTGDALAGGQRVLVTCWAGMNRSVLIASMALARVTRMTADQIIDLMRRRRHPQALYNESFQGVLRRLVRR